MKAPNATMIALQEAARRMERTLASPGKHHKTREYTKTLPKREKAVVSPSDYKIVPIETPSQLRAKARAAAITAAQRVVAKAVADSGTRKDRLRPSARKKPVQGPFQNCRPFQRYDLDAVVMRREYRAIRDKDEVDVFRKMLHWAQSGMCGLCGRHADIDDCSLDHVIPRSSFGRDELGNLMIAHRRCNSDKSNDLPTGCEMVFLLATNARLGVKPDTF